MGDRNACLKDKILFFKCNSGPNERRNACLKDELVFFKCYSGPHSGPSGVRKAYLKMRSYLSNDILGLVGVEMHA